jgi:Sigma-70 region 2
MDENQWLADRFEEERPRLRAVAYRMLGSLAEVDDAVQETWLRLSRAGTGEVENRPGVLEHAALAQFPPGGVPHRARARPRH